MDVHITIEFLVKISLAVLLGGLIGAEREMTQHPAGLRTMILVCMGSTLMMLIPYSLIFTSTSNINITLDHTRVAAGVITGIGFIGAGVIFNAGANVRGLTTAASIWVVSSIGLLVGAGLYFLPILATIIVVIVLHTFHYLEKEYFKYHEYGTLKIKVRYKPATLKNIEQHLKRHKIKISLTNFKRKKEVMTILYSIQMPRSLKKETISKGFIDNKDVMEIEWSS